MTPEKKFWIKIKRILDSDFQDVNYYRIENTVGVGFPDVILIHKNIIIPLELKMHRKNALSGSQLGWHYKFAQSNMSYIAYCMNQGVGLVEVTQTVIENHINGLDAVNNIKEFENARQMLKYLFSKHLT